MFSGESKKSLNFQKNVGQILKLLSTFLFTCVTVDCQIIDYITRLWYYLYRLYINKLLRKERNLAAK